MELIGVRNLVSGSGFGWVEEPVWLGVSVGVKGSVRVWGAGGGWGVVGGMGQGGRARVVRVGLLGGVRD